MRGEKMNVDWWKVYVPTPLESMEVYLNRVTKYDEMEFVMMKVTYDELDIICQSYEITKVRHAYQPRSYAVMVIRDLIFLTYTERYGYVAN